MDEVHAVVSGSGRFGKAEIVGVQGNSDEQGALEQGPWPPIDLLAESSGITVALIATGTK